MVNIAIFSAQPYDAHFLSTTNARLFTPPPPTTTTSQNTTSNDSTSTPSFTLTYHPIALSPTTAPLAASSLAISAFVNDDLSAPVLTTLHALGVRAILLRCAGYNNIDLACATSLGFFIAHVPSYSPEAVAEHAVALLQTLNRHTHRAYNRVREGNFSLDGLLGFTMHGKTVGIVGTGRIGMAVARILKGYGCRLLGHDVYEVDEFARALGGAYVPLEQLLREADVVTLHCPLIAATRHVINEETLGLMKPGAMLVNTSRGGLIDTVAVIKALKARTLGALAIDVYEQESAIFYQDRSAEIIEDDVFQRLMTFPNVLVSGHQGFFTTEALTQISEVTLRNMECFVNGTECPNRLYAKDGA